MTSSDDMRAARTRRPGQAVVEALRAEGVGTVFGMVGSHVLAVYDALCDVPEIRLVNVKHENNASHMADVYGRLTGRPGVVLVTAGPGALNSISAVAQAYDFGSPVVHISGTVPTTSRNETFHGADRPDFLYKTFQDITKWSVRITRAEEIPDTLAEAFAVAVSGRPGPVHVEIPQDILQGAAQDLPAYEVKPRRSLEPDAALLDDVARGLREACNPVIVVGRGVLYHQAIAELRQLAEQLNCPVLVARDAMGSLPDDHPLLVGYFSRQLRNPLGAELVGRSDLVLGVGMRPATDATGVLTQWKADSLYFFGVDPDDPAMPGARRYAAADTRLMLAGLLDRLQGVTRPLDTSLVEQVRRAKEQEKEKAESYLEQYATQVPIHFGLAARELARQLPGDAITVGDIGNTEVWTRLYMPIRNPTTQLRPGNWGAMGFGLPGAIAAKMVHPDRPVVAVVGDGAFMMSFSDFGTAAEVGANILVVVLNDSRWGMIHRLQMNAYGRSYANEIRSPDFVKFAQSFGAAGLRVEDPAELPASIARALSMTAESPVILDIVSGYDWPMP